MDRIEEIREKIGECDDIIIEQLAVRMSHIQEIISYKKATGIPILQPEQEKKQTDALAQKLGDNEFEEEILDIFKYIMKNSRRIQAKSLFDYNIFLIGFMGAGKSTIAGELKDKLEMDRVEMDQMMFIRSIAPRSFVFSVALTMLFNFAVCLLMRRHVRQISMVESMKAPE